ncbi:DUF6456 domain-containing protein [Pacificibacter maritimus]|nr:DUF6456 domain-containing protein [Pacificibacter maritimus]
MFPDWVPQDAKRYLDHTERGLTIRALARRGGCAPSTVMRQVRKIELKRDDPLIDEALSNLSQCAADLSQRCAEQAQSAPRPKDTTHMNKSTDHTPNTSTDGANDALSSGALVPPTDATIEFEARRILRRLSEPGACLAVAQDMEKAVVVRDLPGGRTARTAVLDRPIAQAMALKDWITAQEKGKITRYTITSAGRAALKMLIAADETARAGFAEAPAGFGHQGTAWPVPSGLNPEAEKQKRVRYNAAESPVMTLSRRRDKDGEMFLPPELVGAAERLREDFELAQMDAGAAQDWEQYLTSGAVPETAKDTAGYGPQAAKARVVAALVDLGPGLGDVALRCCCYLEGMENAEKNLGWSARSGKVVLRIALQRLKRHFDQAGYSNLIG